MTDEEQESAFDMLASDDLLAAGDACAALLRYGDVQFRQATTTACIRLYNSADIPSGHEIPVRSNLLLGIALSEWELWNEEPFISLVLSVGASGLTDLHLNVLLSLARLADRGNAEAHDAIRSLQFSPDTYVRDSARRILRRLPES